MLEPHVGVFRRDLKDMRVEISERGREEQRGLIKVDHRFHRLLNVNGFGHVFLFDDDNAFHCLDGCGPFGMGLVIAKVIFRTDVDKPNGQGTVRTSKAKGGGGCSTRNSGCALEKATTRQGGSRHE